MKTTTVPLALLALFLVLAAATQRDLTLPNREMFTEMVRSPAFQSQSANPVFRDGRTLQPPVRGTVPRGKRPLHFSDSAEDRRRAGSEWMNPVEKSLEALTRGQGVYEQFCRHCHGAAGRGDGAVARAVPTFSMPLHGKATADLPDGEMFHILTFGRNHMPSHSSQISPEDRWKVVHFLRELQRKEKARLIRLGLLYEEEKDPRRFGVVSPEYGRELYDLNCSTCHGPDGLNPVRGVPTLNHPRVLAIADEDYYLDIITHGRKGTPMPAWKAALTPTQIQSLVKYIRSWFPAGLDRTRVARERGSVPRGRALFRGNCAPCHGPRGQGGIGNSLSSPSFLALASDDFLRDTIALGRKHTAMPAGLNLASEDISDILAFIRSWSPPKHSYEEVARRIPHASAKMGRKIYSARCASCHGKEGEGGIGSRLHSGSFLALADNQFLYRAIAEGRPGTAMPAWQFLDNADVADLIAHLRSWQKTPAAPPSNGVRRGRPEFGELLYHMACVGCHGPGGRGGTGGQIGNPVFLSSASDEFLWRTIAYGKEGTAMRGFLKDVPGGALMPLASSDIDHLVAWLRQLQALPRVEPLARPVIASSLELGREIYEKKAGCANCHGIDGQGGSGPALGNPDFLRVVPDGYLVATVILGRENTEMLSFYRGGSVQLTMEEVENVAGYVRQFQNARSTRRREVDRSSAAAAQGRMLWDSHCASCHGSEGKGPQEMQRVAGYAPSIHNQEFLLAADDSFLLATVAMGRPGTPMRPFARGGSGISDLSTEDIRRIVAFIRSWEKPRK
ncbi:MAG: c-type cytochrome [Planctomycetes bacterium]|nr:c-type cytochrome [Planctomycetota bacterium]